ncbi:hypothetical protein UPYG_G00158680 [Umbra pygmaea]|uniref:Uncharacterized protein n=1 Tax=Umbra pygmaea TaxID=75934 RepID=A0ABD0X2X4_UMBPY
MLFTVDLTELIWLEVKKEQSSDDFPWCNFKWDRWQSGNAVWNHEEQAFPLKAFRVLLCPVRNPQLFMHSIQMFSRVPGVKEDARPTGQLTPTSPSASPSTQRSLKTSV